MLLPLILFKIDQCPISHVQKKRVITPHVIIMHLVEKDQKEKSQRWQARPFFSCLTSNKLLPWNRPKAAAAGSGLRPLADSKNGRGSLPKAAARGRSPAFMATLIGVLF